MGCADLIDESGYAHALAQNSAVRGDGFEAARHIYVFCFPRGSAPPSALPGGGRHKRYSRNCYPGEKCTVLGVKCTSHLEDPPCATCILRSRQVPQETDSSDSFLGPLLQSEFDIDLNVKLLFGPAQG